MFLKRVSAFEVFAIASFLISTAFIFFSIYDLRVATSDEHGLLQNTSNHIAAEASRVIDFQIGRFYAALKWPTLETLIQAPALILTTVRVGAMLACFFSAALFMSALTKSVRNGILFVVLSTAMMPVTVSYQPLIYNPLIWLGWSCIWLMGVLALKTDTRNTRVAIVGLFTISIYFHESNIVFFGWPWLVAILAKPNIRASNNLKASRLCGAVLVGYLVICFSLRQFAMPLGDPYSGGSISLDFTAFLQSLALFSSGLAPGLEMWLSPRWIGTDVPLFLTPTNWGIRFGQNLDLVTILLAALAGMTVFLRTRNVEKDPRTGSVRVLVNWCLIFCFVIIAPNLLLSITPKYQIWAQQRMWPYYYSSMSFQGIVALMTVGIAGISQGFSGSRRSQIAAMLAIGVSLLAASSAATTREATTLFRKFRFDHSDTHLIEKSPTSSLPVVLQK